MRPTLLTALLLTFLASTLRADEPVLMEFMADNRATLADEDGDFPDWVEVHNPGAAPVSLDGWFLTDDPLNPDKWMFPPVSLDGGGSLVVFASGKNRRIPGANLHTGFSLAAAGGTISLVKPDGVTVASSFASYPPQLPDVSYGQPMQAVEQKLLATGAPLRWRVPADGSLGDTWTQNGFNDSAWTSGVNGVGYDLTLTNAAPANTYAAMIQAAGPVGYWRLAETNGSAAANLGSLGAALNGSFGASTVLGVAGPRPGPHHGFSADNTAAGFGGATSQLVIPDNAAFDVGAGPFAVEMWFYPTSANTRGDLFTYKGTGGDFGIHLASQTANKISVFHGGFIGTPSGNVVNNEWHHLVVTRSSTGTLRVYLNGAETMSATSLGSWNIANALVFGSNHTGVPTSPAIQFAGRIDEPAIYTRNLTPEEVHAHYQRGLGKDVVPVAPGEDHDYAERVASALPLAHWRLNETNGTVAANLGTLGAAADATYRGVVALGQEGPRPVLFNGFAADNRAAGFNGTTEQVIVPDQPAFNFGSGPFAVEMWFHPTSAATRGDLFTYKGVGGDFGIHLASQTANRISVYHNAFIATGGNVVNNQWYHLVVTRGATGVISMYLNGALAASVTNTQSMDIASDLIFGSNHAGTPTAAAIQFRGRIDEPAIYNRELTAAEAQRRYSQGVGAPVDFTSHLATDLASALHNQAPGVYLRIPFTVADPGAVDRLVLRMKYDDGFVAQVNGAPALAVNAPEPAAWNATATAAHADSDAVQFEEIEIQDVIPSLQPGANVLALHALNVSAASHDLLAAAELVARTLLPLGSNAVYLLNPTPGADNTAGGEPGPSLTLPAHTPAAPGDADDLLVTVRTDATLGPVATVTLNYRVMFGSTNTVAMLDNGLSGDGAAGDGVYGAVIPAAAAAPGQMIRWFFTATDTGARASRWPVFAASSTAPAWLGTVVRSVTANIPVWEWFAQNTAAARSATGTRGAVWFNGEFYDNVFIRSRGASTSLGSQKFDFNPGYHAYINPTLGRVEEVNLNANGSDPSFIRPPLAFETYRRAGHPACESFHMVLRANGAADRVAYFVEQVDDDFLKRNGLDPEGALYKFNERGATGPVFTDATIGIEKKTRRAENNADLQAFVTGLNQSDVNARRAWFFDHVNAPSLFNLLALSRITQDSDDVRKNFYLHRDTNGNGEWSIFPWDKDWTFGILGDGPPHLYHPFFGDQAHPKTAGNQWNLLWDCVFNDPVLRPMFLRRLRTVMDDHLQPPGTLNGDFERRAAAWMATLAPNVSAAVTNELASVLAFFPGRRTGLYQTYSAATGTPPDALVPDAQPAGSVVRIGDIDFSPSTGIQDMEYIQLVNTNNHAVDISGWRLADAVTMTFDPGTVIPAGGALYASPDAAAFRARPSGPSGGQQLQVQDRYNGHLSSFGETITLLDAATNVVDTLTYAGDPSDAQENLVISEIHYNPSSAADQEEFVELVNISTTLTLDLNGVAFTNGIRFAFAGSAVTNLAPGARVVVVRDAAAFASAFGGGRPVAGVFTGAFDNGGEPVKLEDAFGGTIAEFAYDDVPLWPVEADGGGASLVLIHPAGRPDPADPLSWRASLAPNPGDTDATGYAAWKTTHGITDDGADGDGDGLNALLEYATGSDPAVPSAARMPVITREPTGAIRVTVRMALTADDVRVVLEQGFAGAESFQPAPAAWAGRGVEPGGVLVLTHEVPAPAPDRRHYRARYELRGP